jgi:hypothetical protein
MAFRAETGEGCDFRNGKLTQGSNENPWFVAHFSVVTAGQQVEIQGGVKKDREQSRG